MNSLVTVKSGCVERKNNALWKFLYIKNIKTCQKHRFCFHIVAKNSDTTETFLTDMGMENYIAKFNEERITVELLMVLSEDELKEILEEIRLPAGIKMRIRREIKKKRDKGKNIMCFFYI